MESKITVLCVPINATGHINACLGLSQILKKRGHRIVFATDKVAEGTFLKHGFEEVIYEEPAKVLNTFMEEAFAQFRSPAVQQQGIIVAAYRSLVSQSKELHPQMKNLVCKVKPDIIIQDNVGTWPALFATKIPTIVLCSTNPLQVMEYDGLPPWTSGLPLSGAQDQWGEYRDTREKLLFEIWKEFNQWVQEVGAPELPYLKFNYIQNGQTFYIYPRSLAAKYLVNHPSQQTFFGIDHVLRQTSDTFEVPEKLQNLPGKLILLTMGTLGSGDLTLMKLLVRILSKSKHKFIVSKGQRHSEFELAPNMWGEEYLPQLAVLPLVDLAIIHGGNNSFVETLYFGKPMIVIPMFVDQHDNYRMAIEAKLGDGHNVFLEPEEDLLSKIDQVSEDGEIQDNVKRISKELQESQTIEEAATRVEQIALTKNTL